MGLRKRWCTAQKMHLSTPGRSNCQHILPVLQKAAFQQNAQLVIVQRGALRIGNTLVFHPFVSRSSRRKSVPTPCSSNWMCGSPASGFRIRTMRRNPSSNFTFLSKMRNQFHFGTIRPSGVILSSAAGGCVGKLEIGTLWSRSLGT